MRMWMIPPGMLCRKHLLGEHNEIHKAVGYAKHGNSLSPWVKRGFLFPNEFLARHEQLAEEMLLRGYSHDSPLVVASVSESFQAQAVRAQISVKDLSERCSDCRESIISYLKK